LRRGKSLTLCRVLLSAGLVDRFRVVVFPVITGRQPKANATIERLLAATITCRLQKRSLFAYLADVLTANIRGDPIPALA
jgi:riboflavin biosynthesis pyrimidine reductase